MNNDQKKTQLKPGIRKLIRFSKTTLVLAVLLIIAFLLFSSLNRKTDSTGLSYLTKQHALDIESVQTNVDEQIQAEEERKKQEQKEQLLNSLDDPSQLYPAFADSMIVGDSRTIGFAYYTPLDSSVVFANIGDTILKCANYYETIQSREPEYLFIMYGTNDLANFGVDGTIERYEETIRQIQSLSPDTKILLMSLLPASEQGLLNDPSLAYADEFNDRLQQLCEQTGCIYIDGSVLDLPGNPQFYAPDGIHFDSAFYEPLAQLMLKAALENS